jgi:hypothetical protein
MSDEQYPDNMQVVAARLRAAVASNDLAAYGALLDEHVRWGGEEDTPDTCHNRTQVLEHLARQQRAGMRTTLLDVTPGTDAVLLALHVTWPVAEGFARERTVYQVLKVRDQHIVDIRGYSSRASAARQIQGSVGAELKHPIPDLDARRLVPILNVSSLPDSFAWFARLGWSKAWDWRGDSGPPSFGSLTSGNYEIFLCLDGQGGRGREPGIGGGGQGVWLSIWVDDVDAVYAVCQREHMEVLQPPRNEPWGVREMHVRHPDGHVLRMTASIPHSH